MCMWLGLHVCMQISIVYLVVKNKNQLHKGRNVRNVENEKSGFSTNPILVNSLNLRFSLQTMPHTKCYLVLCVVLSYKYHRMEKVCKFQVDLMIISFCLLMKSIVVCLFVLLLTFTMSGIPLIELPFPFRFCGFECIYFYRNVNPLLPIKILNENELARALFTGW